jgi:hypothetical protein
MGVKGKDGPEEADQILPSEKFIMFLNDAGPTSFSLNLSVSKKSGIVGILTGFQILEDKKSRGGIRTHHVSLCII